MKKISVCLLLIFCLGFNCANASCHKGANHHHPRSHTYYHSHSYSSPAYIVRVENDYHKENFPNCEKHYMETQTTINYYSDGSRRTYVNSTIYNNDGSILVSDCNRVNHIVYKNEHYFIICKNRGGCSIINSSGDTITKQSYSKIEELKENRFLVKHDKKFGIIDIKENIIVPIKYKKFQKISDNVFISKLNGYFGIIDVENNVLVKNDCEKIKLFQNTLLLKRYGKYGLCDLEGNVIFDIEYDKIKRLGEYIVIKKDKQYQILDYRGDKISDLQFKKVKLERNTLYGYKDKTWNIIK